MRYISLCSCYVAKWSEYFMWILISFQRVADITACWSVSLSVQCQLIIFNKNSIHHCAVCAVVKGRTSSRAKEKWHVTYIYEKYSFSSAKENFALHDFLHSCIFIQNSVLLRLWCDVCSHVIFVALCDIFWWNWNLPFNISDSLRSEIFICDEGWWRRGRKKRESLLNKIKLNYNFIGSFNAGVSANSHIPLNVFSLIFVLHYIWILAGS